MKKIFTLVVGMAVVCFSFSAYAQKSDEFEGLKQELGKTIPVIYEIANRIEAYNPSPDERLDAVEQLSKVMVKSSKVVQEAEELGFSRLSLAYQRVWVAAFYKQMQILEAATKEIATLPTPEK